MKQNRWSDPEGKSHSKVTIVAEHVEFRPEFKKETKSAQEIPDEDDYENEENGELVTAMEEKEVETVAF